MATPTATSTTNKQLRRAVNWLLNDGVKYKHVTPGQTNYVNGNRHPFPLNPTFRPNPPLAEKTRTEIFTLWYNNPIRWTPRQISNEYNISIKRAEAILRLKAFGARQASKGVTMQTKYVEPKMVLRELSHETVPHVDKPRYIAVSEETQFGTEEAAKLLGRPFYSHITEEADQKGLGIITRAQLKLDVDEKDTEAKQIEHNPQLGNKRWES
ncbi:eukaryotic mitochondrial regulator protein-domain-containing protein [Syncephalis plumigaleata]|nr:eukaryotic mitochondrial regulator protein-domain-containing protein [Syncephalis plumigaleata]